MKIKYLLVLFNIFFVLTATKLKIDPLSEIKVSSNQAICQRNKKDKTIINFDYIQDVKIIFADQSQAQADKLLIKINTKTNPTKVKKDKLENLKQIKLTSNVYLKRENRNVKADIIKIHPNTRICQLFGNVEIEQFKKNQKDFPLKTICQKATLDLTTDKITLIGAKNNPVKSIIKLEGHPGLLKKIKPKKNNG